MASSEQVNQFLETFVGEGLAHELNDSQKSGVGEILDSYAGAGWREDQIAEQIKADLPDVTAETVSQQVDQLRAEMYAAQTPQGQSVPGVSAAPAESPEPSDDELLAEAAAVLANDMNAAIAANVDTWSRALLQSLVEEVRPFVTQAISEYPDAAAEIAADREGFSEAVKECLLVAAQAMLDGIEADGGDLALLRRGGFGDDDKMVTS